MEDADSDLRPSAAGSELTGVGRPSLQSLLLCLSPCSCPVVCRFSPHTLLAATLKYDSKRTKTDDFNAEISKKISVAGRSPLPRPHRQCLTPNPLDATQPPAPFWQLAP